MKRKKQKLNRKQKNILLAVGNGTVTSYLQSALSLTHSYETPIKKQPLAIPMGAEKMHSRETLGEDILNLINVMEENGEDAEDILHEIHNLVQEVYKEELKEVVK